jgi:predicted HAD superfamily Cof-like phosphohydrolase
MYFNTYMKKELEMVAEFHKKFDAPIAAEPTLIPEDRTALRYRLMSEEVTEYSLGTTGQDLENVAKELADILYATYGTILEHGLQDKMPEIFAEVHRSNMSKDFAQFKAVKGPNYTPADIKKLLT